MKKSLARGAAVAFMSAAIVLPLSGAAQAMAPGWNHPDHQQHHCRHHHHHHHHHHRFFLDGGFADLWGGGFFQHH